MGLLKGKRYESECKEEEQNTKSSYRISGNSGIDISYVFGFRQLDSNNSFGSMCNLPTAIYNGKFAKKISPV